MKRGNLYFTIVELIVVIAITMILAGMFLPALNKARLKAKELYCASNLNQLSKITTMYANDYNNFLIPIYTDASAGKSWPLNLQLLGYSKNILSLRENAFKPPVGDRYDQFYGLMMTTSSLENSKQIDKIGFRNGALKPPSRFPLLMDSVATGATIRQTYYLNWAGASNFDSTRFINMRHNKRANIAAADGHVSSNSDKDAKKNFSLENSNDALFTVSGGAQDIFNLLTE